MKLRATAVQRRLADVSQEPMVDGRLEVQWLDNEPWLSITGMLAYYEQEWLLTMSIMQLGARRGGVEFIYLDMTKSLPLR